MKVKIKVFWLIEYSKSKILNEGIDEDIRSRICF